MHPEARSALILRALRLEDAKLLSVMSVPVENAPNLEVSTHVLFRIRHCVTVDYFQKMLMILASFAEAELSTPSRRLISQYEDYKKKFGSVSEVMESCDSIGLSSFGKICIRFRLYELGQAIHDQVSPTRPVYHFITRPRRSERWDARTQRLRRLETQIKGRHGATDRRFRVVDESRNSELNNENLGDGIAFVIGPERGDLKLASASIGDAGTIESVVFEFQSDNGLLKSAVQLPPRWPRTRHVVFDPVLETAYFNVNSRHSAIGESRIGSSSSVMTDEQVGLRLLAPFSIDLNHEIGVGPFVLIGSWSVGERVGIPVSSSESEDGPKCVDVRDGTISAGLEISLPNADRGEFGLAVNSTYRTKSGNIMNAGWYIPFRVDANQGRLALRVVLDQSNPDWRPLGGGFAGTSMDNRKRYGMMSLNETLSRCQGMALVYRHSQAEALYSFPGCVIDPVVMTVENRSLLSPGLASIWDMSGLSSEAAERLTNGRIGCAENGRLLDAQGAYCVRWKFSAMAKPRYLSIHQDCIAPAKSVSVSIVRADGEVEHAWSGNLPPLDLEHDVQTVTHVTLPKIVPAAGIELRVIAGNPENRVALDQFEVFGETAAVCGAPRNFSRSIAVNHKKDTHRRAVRLAVAKADGISFSDWRSIN